MLESVKNKARNIYEKDYKKLLIFPLLLILASFLIIGFNYYNTGEIFKKDVSLRGGVTITIPGHTDADINELEGFMASEFVKGDVSVRAISQLGERTGIIVDAGVEREEDIQELLNIVQKKIGKLDKNDYSIRVIGSTLGESFFREAMFTVLVAFLLMGIVVIIYFRNLIPSFFVIQAVFADILCTFATLVLFQQSFSSATIAAMLMLIGFSVDTDILLTARVLKNKEGTVFERNIEALKTGLTLSLAALAAVLAGYSVAQSETIKQIMLVLAIGLVFDIIHTWITNAGVLRWYLEAKAKEKVNEDGKA